MSRKGAPRVGMIQPRLAGFGGLEKYGAHTIRTLADRYPLEVVCEQPIDPATVQHAFDVALFDVRFRCDARCNPKTPVGEGWSYRIAQRQAAADYRAVTRPYDVLVAQTLGLPLASGASRSVMLCHFPVVRDLLVDPKAPRGWSGLLTSHGRQQRAIQRRLGSWDRIIANSEFTRGWIRRYWDRDADVIHPPIELPEVADLREKRPWILGIGFFRPPEPEIDGRWSYKRQELLLDVFRALCDEGFCGWELHLAGHRHNAPEVDAFVRGLEERAAGYPVHFHINCGHEELLSLYRQSSIFWHATGFGVDPERAPERMEHFGMVTAEAMGYGCIPIVVNRGGQPEVLGSSEAGCLWDTVEELKDYTRAVASDAGGLHRRMEHAAQRARYFGLPRFREQVATLVDQELEQVGRLIG